MSFKEYIKEKVLTTSLLIFALITIEIFLAIYPLGRFIKIYIPIVIITVYCIGIMIEYLTKKAYYNNMINIINELEEKYLITELIRTPTFEEGKILKNVLEQTNKSMIENVDKYKYITQDYKDYIELWIHEIKLPIAVSKMIIENNKSIATKNIEEELDKVENYIEQALYYARSNTVEKDYYIRKSKLKEIVNECIKKNKNALIQQKIKINIHDIDLEVNTDNKWIIFILNQIIQNSIKYVKKYENTDTMKIGKYVKEEIKKHTKIEKEECASKGEYTEKEKEEYVNSEIEIYAKQEKEKIVLYIEDNGIGIKDGEIARVFEKGFTGTNGRQKNKKSTGIGLYLCKKLCNKLGIAIEIKSIEEEGTQVSLIFPQNSFLGGVN